MTTAKDIADMIGRQEIATKLGVGATAVSNAVVDNKFPSSWFIVLSEMSAIAKIDCPPGLFGMRGAAL